MRWILLAGVMVAVAGCATGQQRAAIGGQTVDPSTYERNLDKPWQFRRPPGEGMKGWGGFGKDIQVGY